MVGAVRFESKTPFSAVFGKSALKARYYWVKRRFHDFPRSSSDHPKTNF
jgi:hypothetical protein